MRELAMDGDHMTDVKKPWGAVLLTAAISLVVTIVGGVITWHLTDGLRNPAAETNLPSATTSVVEGLPTPVTSETSYSEPIEEPTPDTPYFTPVSLTTQNDVGGERCHVPGNTGSPWEQEIGPIAGVPYVAGVSCRIIFERAAGNLEYLVPAGATRLTAIAGQRDDAANTSAIVRFEVTNAVTGEVLTSYDLPYGEAGAIDVAVAGLVRVSLSASVLSTVDSPRSASIQPAFAEPSFR